MTGASAIRRSTGVVDWRDRIFTLYAEIRALHPTDPEAAFARFRAVRDELFKNHPASPLDSKQRRAFERIPYAPYRHEFNLRGFLAPVDEQPPYRVALEEDGELTMRHIADARFSFGGEDHVLPVYWLDGYAGGIFVPFRDPTNGSETYGGGRYLFDTRKGANPGLAEGEIRLDFNFAYNPSCAYNPRWVCPLARPESDLQLPVLAGERAEAW